MKTILVVDDEEMDRVLLGSVLEQTKYEVLFAPDGARALEIYKEQHVDAVVTDLIMPRLNGFRLIRELQEHDANVCILAVTGRGREHLDFAKAYGALGTLTKPFDPVQLLKAVEEMVRIRTLKVNPWRLYWTAEELGSTMGAVVPSRWDHPV